MADERFEGSQKTVIMSKMFAIVVASTFVLSIPLYIVAQNYKKAAPLSFPAGCTFWVSLWLIGLMMWFDKISSIVLDTLYGDGALYPAEHLTWAFFVLSLFAALGWLIVFGRRASSNPEGIYELKRKLEIAQRKIELGRSLLGVCKWDETKGDERRELESKLREMNQ